MIESLNKVLIYGAGMMGASLALALKNHPSFTGKVVAAVRTNQSAEFLSANHLADQVIQNPTVSEIESLSFDFVVLGTPVLTTIDLLKKLNLNCLVTDMGSTKLQIQKVANQTRLSFVGSHPMCGSENAGPQQLVAGLFEKRLCIITNDTQPNVTPAQVEQVTRFWSDLGMYTITADSMTHDKVIAQLSHGPHFISSALALSLLTDQNLVKINESAPIPITGGGLRDMLRISGSNPQMWHDILKTNQDQIVSFLKSFRSSLDSLIQYTESENSDWVIDYQKRALAARMLITRNQKNDK
ncbi:MAG: prephenate dehydrogenase/arogenate dehydrogenase family protein [Leptonema sp. (in: Bacteria)]|nr:prephenate dehydrogenase/arogenate dehydrogenase family protein [Leptonema sp. (in: bacteria)]